MDFGAIPWMSCQSGQGGICFLQLDPVSLLIQTCYMESELQMTTPILECGFSQIIDDNKWQTANCWSVYYGLCWQLLIFVLAGSSVWTFRLHCSLFSRRIWASVKFCQYGLHIYPYENKIVEKFSEYCLCIFQTKIRLWSIRCIAEGITNNVLTFTLKQLVWCVTMRLAVIV
jgi:hypothetical protein